MTHDTNAHRNLAEPLLVLSDVHITYRAHGRRGQHVHALRGVNLELGAGRTLGVVGESGSGKTTLGRAILGLIRPSSGMVQFGDRPLAMHRRSRSPRGRMQVVLQNPDWSLNPTIYVWRSVAEPLINSGLRGRHRLLREVEVMLELVGLSPTVARRRPHELSGGQRQRVAIARAIISRPDLIVFDEAVTALDASVQIQVLNLIRDIQAERGFAAVFISHDLAAVRYVANDIAVFRDGQILEHGPVARFYGVPDHPYSRELMATLFVP
jgi:ABC-type glutathione transport system ATPase component